MSAKLLLEYQDFEVGREFMSNKRAVTTEEIRSFAQEFDPQPFHTDPSVEHPLLGRLAASGWHTAAVAMRLLTETISTRWGIVGAGVENIRWPAPMHAGDVVHLEVMVLDRRELMSKPGVGLVRLGLRVVGRHARPLLEMQPKILVPLELSSQFQFA